MASRAKNERKFRHLEQLPNGGRRYVREFGGRAGGRARYVKEVDANENTARFVQEIYDTARWPRRRAREISRRFRPQTTVRLQKRNESHPPNRC